MNTDKADIILMMSQVGEPPLPHLRGLVSKDLLNGTTILYQSNRQEGPPVLVGEFHSILLPNVTCSDSGLYTCHLAAPVGEKNQNGQILLTLTGEKPLQSLIITKWGKTLIEEMMMRDC